MNYSKLSPVFDIGDRRVRLIKSFLGSRKVKRISQKSSARDLEMERKVERVCRFEKSRSLVK